MGDDLSGVKRQLRDQARRLFAGAPPVLRLIWDREIISRLSGLLIKYDMKNIAAYSPLPDEPDITPFLLSAKEKGINLFMPRRTADRTIQFHRIQSLSGDMLVGSHGIAEPKADLPTTPLVAADMILVPGRLFAPDGMRLGRGWGYYDRVLSTFSGAKVALAYDFQIFESLPTELHDKKVDIIITPTRMIMTGDQDPPAQQ